LAQINQIDINGVVYKIVFHAGGDLKWLANCYGINAANSAYPCLWCTWKMKDILKDPEDIEVTHNINRSHKEALTCLRKKNVDTKKGYVNEALFPFIPYDKMVVDMLHLTLRVTDKLFEELLLRIEELDNLDELKKNGTALNNLRTFIETECKVTCPFYVKEKDQDSKVKLRKINQNERIKILDELSNRTKNRTLASIFTEKQHREDKVILRLSRVFYEFSEIMKIVKKTRQDINLDELKLKLKSWLKDFIKVRGKITPYIHILCFHLPAFIENFRNINLYSMQGLEKSNHIAKVYFHRQTNHHKLTFTKTLLEKINRKEYIHLQGILEN